MLKFAMAAVIALTAGNAYAQRTGKEVINGSAGFAADPNKWVPQTFPGNTEVSPLTGTFHAGGVAACDGCHVMHNASSGVARSTKVAPWTNAVPAFLLQGSDQSSTCLICHGDASPATATTPWVIVNTTNNGTNTNYSPGGDFGWLGAPAAGGRSGHSVVAMDFNMVADSVLTAPGGSYNTSGTGVSAFACSSCHDPHGRFRMEMVSATDWKWTGPTAVPGLVDPITKPIYASGSYGVLPTAIGAVGAYRLLAGVGYSPASMVTGAFPFVNNPPVAVAPTDYNRTEAVSEVRVAYGAGMSEWCQNCHTNIHLDNYVSGAMGASGLRHPAGNGAFLKPGQVDVYNKYISSGNFAAVSANRYTSLVPFENSGIVGATPTGGTMAGLTALAAATANPAAAVFVASTDSNVMCLSCHRAHASAFSSMGRWNFDDTFITNSTVLVDTQNRTAPVLERAYYGRTKTTFGNYQRSMCNKCHGKD
jgi:hypothetical protein